MIRKLLSFVLVGLLMLQAPLWAGGFLETVDITGLIASSLPGHVVGKLVPIRWEVRTIPVRYVVNDTMDPFPNPLGPAFLTLADATTAACRRAYSLCRVSPATIHNSRLFEGAEMVRIEPGWPPAPNAFTPMEVDAGRHGLAIIPCEEACR